MGGIVGRLFREFAVTLSVAIVVSMVVSLTTTPMMCAHLLQAARKPTAGSIAPASALSTGWSICTAEALNVVLRHSFVTLLVLLGTIALNVYLFIRVPKGFFPAAGHRPPERAHPGRPGHFVPAAWTTSCCRWSTSSTPIRRSIPSTASPAADAAAPPTRARMFISLKPLERAKGHRRPDHRAPAAQAGQRSRRHAVPAGRPRTSASAAARATRSINSPCAATTSRT